LSVLWLALVQDWRAVLLVECALTRSEQGESSRPVAYARLLKRYGNGYPISISEGTQWNLRLSEARRDRGMSVSDVGYIRASGSFKDILEHAN
jgi:hypothetical protein